ncbi:hypothetical protein FUA23_17490 [Neolewinella aurantiaca]|uniref:Uncharacterized protein n=1 Tax=Neolewinella aurantiaca TaxID=2602767 RepID=A0A5C7FAA7_9BACT|nr:DUF6427 family protein [Neolewinella aurantiaca]TXF87727.1 hypothetical protein FUA23_17490 [Neolewinella aurantiaca]
MLSLFRTNQASAGLLLFFYALLLQLPAFFGTPDAAGAEVISGTAGRTVVGWLEGKRWLSLLLPVLLVTMQGIVANMLVTRYRLSRKVTQFPGLFIVLCWGLIPAFRELQSFHFANLFLMLGLLSLASVYKKEEAAVPLFNAGAWLGLASLFVPLYLCLLPALIIGVGTLRRPDLRSIMQLLVGGGLMYFLGFTIAYIFGNWEGVPARNFSGLRFVEFTGIEASSLPGLIALGVLLLVVMGSYGNIVRLLNIEGKKNSGIIAWVLFFGALSLLLSSVGLLPALQVLVCPLGLLVGLRFILLPSGRAEFFHLILFVLAVGPLLWRAFGG